MAKRASKYSGKFDAHVKAMQKARSLSAMPEMEAGPTTSDLIASMLKDERFNRPISVASPEELFAAEKARVQAEIDKAIGPSFGDRALDVISRGSYMAGNLIQQGSKDLGAAMANRAGAATPEQKANVDRNFGETLADLGGAAWEGLSGKEKITPSGALRENLNQSEGGREFLAGARAVDILGINADAALGFGVDVALDPINLIGGGAIRNTAAVTKAVVTGKGIEGVKAGLKSTSTAKAAKDAATIAVRENRAVPRSVMRQLEAAKTDVEVADAIKQADAAVKSDAITQRFAQIERNNPEVTAPREPELPVGPRVAEAIARAEANPAAVTPAKLAAAKAADDSPTLRAIKAGSVHTIADGAASNASQAAMFNKVRNDAAKRAKADFALSSALKSNDGPVRAATRRTWDDTLEQLKIVEEAGLAKGVPHVVKSSPTARAWPITTTDILQTVEARGYDRSLFVGIQRAPVPIEAVHAATAKALDISTEGLNKTAAVAKIRQAMKDSGKPGNTVQMTRLANAIYDATPNLLARAGANRARMGLKHDEDITLLVGEEGAKIQQALLSDFSQVVETLTSAAANVTRQAEAVGAAPATVVTAQVQVAEQVANAVDEATLRGIQTNRSVVSARVSGAPAAEVHNRVVAGARAQERIAVAEARAAGMVNEPGDAYAIGMVAQMAWMNRMRIRNNAETRGMLEIVRSQGPTGYAGHEIGEFNKGLNAWRTKYTPEQQQAALSELRQGGRSNAPEIDATVRQIFDPSYGPMSSLWRNGASVTQINEALKQSFRGAKGTTPKFDEAIAGDNFVALADQWKDWKIENPTDFFSRAYDAVRKLSAQQTVAISLETHFGSKVYRNGYKRIKPAEDSKIASHLDPKMWYPPHVAEKIDYLEWAAGQPRSFSKEAKQGKKVPMLIDNFYDPLLSTLKTYMTIVRPGHHVRNATSEAMMSHMAGMNNVVKYNAQAAQILSGRASKISQRVTLRGGQTYNLTGDALLRDFRAQGLQPNYHTTEDILAKDDFARGRIDKAVNDNRLVRTGGKVSELVSAEGRLAQYIWEMQRPENIRNAVDLPHLKAIAARNVRKWHPDAAGLGAKEAKYARRIIPFYSWIRQAVPLVAEATVTRPGRILAIPKANYNLAVSNGVDPESLSEQFPEDSIYPTYFTENLLGPVGKDGTAFNLGSPAEAVYGDILNKFGNDPQMVLGDISPIIKAPVELMSGARIDSGREIYDRGEYVDSTIPLWSNASSISGYSLTNSLASALPGGATPAMDPQRSVELGNKEHWFNAAMVNFFSGIGLTNYGNESDRNNAMRQIKEIRAGG